MTRVPLELARPGRAALLRDGHGRIADDLRVSLTSACDLACSFCHHEGMSRGTGLMSGGEIGRLGRVAAGLGVRYAKLTGGEPLLRADVVDVVREVAPAFEEVSLVTNGRRLAPVARALRAAGLARVNVSLPSLDAETYRRITGHDAGPTIDGIDAAVAAGLDPVKVNVVVSRENVAELPRFVEWATDRKVALQLIEIHAPPGAPTGILGERVPLDGIERWLGARAIGTSAARLHARRRYHMPGTTVDVTRPQENPAFCAACTRLRLTHDGRLKPCLMRADNLVDVLGPLRTGATDAEIAGLFAEAAGRRAPFWARPIAEAI